MLALAALGLLCAGSRRPARAATDPAAVFMAAIAQARADQGLAPLTVTPELIADAGRHAAQMAQSGAIWHDPNLARDVANWTRLGDNVGRGPTPESIAAAFFASPTHRAVILNPVYTQLGVATVWAGPTLYVDEIFRRPAAPAALAAGVPRQARRPQTQVVRPAPAVPRPVSASAPAAPAVLGVDLRRVDPIRRPSEALILVAAALLLGCLAQPAGWRRLGLGSGYGRAP